MYDLKSLSPNLMVENVEKAIEFYQNILGFKVTSSVPLGRDPKILQWCSMRLGDVEIMLHLRENLEEELPALKDIKISASLTFFIDVENLNELYEKVKDKVEIVQDLHNTFYGTTEFAIKDLGGYILTFAESISK